MLHRICFAGLMALSLGCGPSDPLNRQAVSGTVTLDGQPLDQGTIEFVPAAGSQGILSGALISDGEFSVPRDKGLPPGTYNVRISSGDASGGTTGGAAVPPGDMGPGAMGDVKPAAERIPAKYNVASELSAEVVAGGANRFPFELTSN